MVFFLITINKVEYDIDRIKGFLKEKKTIEFEVNGRTYKWEGIEDLELGLGYSGVMTLDGQLTFVLSMRITSDMEDKLTIISGAVDKLNKKPRVLEQGIINYLKTQEEILGKNLEHIERIAPRNGSHNFGKQILSKNNDDMELWAFAISKNNDLVEVGFSSGQVNSKQGIGLEEFDEFPTSASQKRATGVLNRTKQKKAMEYLRQVFNEQSLGLMPADTRNPTDIKFHY